MVSGVFPGEKSPGLIEAMSDPLTLIEGFYREFPGEKSPGLIEAYQLDSSGTAWRGAGFRGRNPPASLKRPEEAGARR